MIKLRLMALCRVGSADNKADHYTKLLAAAAAFILHRLVFASLQLIMLLCLPIPIKPKSVTDLFFQIFLHVTIAMSQS
jgi:hypothetical protein